MSDKKTNILKHFDSEKHHLIEALINASIDIDLDIQSSVDLVSMMLENATYENQTLISITNTNKVATIHDKKLIFGISKLTNDKSKLMFCNSSVLYKPYAELQSFFETAIRNNSILLFSNTEFESSILDLIETDDSKRNSSSLSGEQARLKENLCNMFKKRVVKSNLPCIFYNFDEKTISKMEKYFNAQFNAIIVYEKEFDFDCINQLFLAKLEEHNCVFEEGYKEYLYSYYEKFKNEINSHAFNHFLTMINTLIFESKKDGVFLNKSFGVVSILEKIKNVNVDSIFEGIVGLDEVKSKLNDIKAYYNLKTLMAINSSTNIDMRLHLLLTGNPGTGKTTVARLYSQFLKELGVVSNYGCAELKADDFISKWVGDSTLKANSLISKLKGYVIFIDEAYAMAMNSHGEESMSVIVKEMERNSSDTIFVFAGYKKEMQEFLNVNSGIKSRIAFHIELEDYSNEQLSKIFEIKIRKAGFEISEDFRKSIVMYLEDKVEEKTTGNGRFIENLVNEVILKHAQYIYENQITTNINKISINTLHVGCACA